MTENGLGFQNISCDLLARGICVRFRASGNSMYPFIKSGDIIHVDKADTGKIGRWDIILYRGQDGGIVVHRVVNVLRRGTKMVFFVKGDTPPNVLEQVDAEMVLGKVAGVEKNSRLVRIDCGIRFFFNKAYAGLLPLSRWAYLVFLRLRRMTAGRMYYEEDLILRCCRHAGCKMTSQGMDEGYFFQRAYQERVAPLIFDVLSKAEKGSELLSQQAMECFRDTYFTTLKRNVLIGQAVKRVLSGFEAVGIEPIIFKGIILIKFIYRDLGLRPMVDVDMLIRQKDFMRADEALKTLGYFPAFEIKDASLVTSNAYRNSLLYKNESGTPRFIHLYWHLLNLFSSDDGISEKFDMEKVWGACRTVDFDGMVFTVLSDTHELIYLCLHAFKHAFSPLILLCDIDRWVRAKGGGFDWDKLVEESFLFGLSKFVYHSLSIVSKLFGTDIPASCLLQLRPEKISFFENKLAADALSFQPQRLRIPMGFVYLGMNETLGKRVSFLYKALFPARREMAIIRQKDTSEVCLLDYWRRLLSGIRP